MSGIHDPGKQFAAEFTKPKYLCLHEQGHLLKQNDPQHSCMECSKKFYWHRNLLAHINRVHTQERKYICKICGNSFKGRAQLYSHMKLHTGKHQSCPQCDKKFIRSADLVVHLRSHTGEMPYSCDLCGKRFAIRVRLTYHMQRHKGIEHPCQYCDAIYNNRNKLKEHMFKHTGMPYRCEKCPGVEFTRRLRFINHMRRVHDRVMTDDELAQMFAKNTGKVIRFKQLATKDSEEESQDNEEEEEK